jgi:hypothetical protein
MYIQAKLNISMPIAYLLLLLFLAINGALMLMAPEVWYRLVPGVSGTGPLNVHFVKDIGCAYLVAAASFFWLRHDPRTAWPAAFASSAFLTMHALIHVGDAVFFGHGLHHWKVELPGIFLVPAVAMYLSWPSRYLHRSRGEQAC